MDAEEAADTVPNAGNPAGNFTHSQEASPVMPSHKPLTILPPISTILPMREPNAFTMPAIICGTALTISTMMVGRFSIRATNRSTPARMILSRLPRNSVHQAADDFGDGGNDGGNDLRQCLNQRNQQFDARIDDKRNGSDDRIDNAVNDLWDCFYNSRDDFRQSTTKEVSSLMPVSMICGMLSKRKSTMDKITSGRASISTGMAFRMPSARPMIS